MAQKLKEFGSRNPPLIEVPARTTNKESGPRNLGHLAVANRALGRGKELPNPTPQL